MLLGLLLSMGNSLFRSFILINVIQMMAFMALVIQQHLLYKKEKRHRKIVLNPYPADQWQCRHRDLVWSTVLWVLPLMHELGPHTKSEVSSPNMSLSPLDLLSTSTWICCLLGQEQLFQCLLIKSQLCFGLKLKHWHPRKSCSLFLCFFSLLLA